MIKQLRQLLRGVGSVLDIFVSRSALHRLIPDSAEDAGHLSPTQRLAAERYGYELSDIGAFRYRNLPGAR